MTRKKPFDPQDVHEYTGDGNGPYVLKSELDACADALREARDEVSTLSATLGIAHTEYEKAQRLLDTYKSPCGKEGHVSNVAGRPMREPYHERNRSEDRGIEFLAYRWA